MLDANYTKFYAYLSNHTGIPLHELNFEKVNDVFDTLYVQVRFHIFPLSYSYILELWNGIFLKIYIFI